MVYDPLRMHLRSLLRAARDPALAVPALLLLLLAALTAYAPTADPDLWWHLRIGEQALRLRSRLPVEIFSYPFAGQPWPYKDLLADVLLHLLYASAGYRGFFLLKLLAGLSLALSLRAALPPGQRPAALVLLISGLLLCSLGLVERPNLFTLMLFPALLALLERARRLAAAPALSSQLRALLPPLLLVWLWAQLHRAAMVGFVLLLLHAAYLVLGCLTPPSATRLLGPRPTRRAALCALLTALLAPLLGLINPSGAALFRTSLGVAQSAMLRTFITEWRPVDLALFLRSPGGALSVLGTAALLWRLYRALRGGAGLVSLWHLGLVLLFGGRLLLDSVRWQPYLIDSAALSLALVLAERWPQLRQRIQAKGRVPRGAVLLLGLALCGLQLWTRPDPLALGASEVLQPRGAVAFARREGLRGPVLNAYGLGGALIHDLWPQVRVVADGRNDMIYPTAFIEGALRAQRDPAAFAALAAQAPATWVMAWNRPDHVSHAFLAADPAWALVYWDDVATIYVRRDAHPALAQRALRLIDPQALEAGVARLLSRHLRPGGDEALLARLEHELLLLVQAAPRSLRANGALLIYYARRGPAYAERRDAVVRSLDAFAPDDPAIARLKAHLGL